MHFGISWPILLAHNFMPTKCTTGSCETLRLRAAVDRSCRAWLKNAKKQGFNASATFDVPLKIVDCWHDHIINYFPFGEKKNCNPRVCLWEDNHGLFTHTRPAVVVPSHQLSLTKRMVLGKDHGIPLSFPELWTCLALLTRQLKMLWPKFC